MATNTAETTVLADSSEWQYGVIAGILAAIAMGALMVVQLRPVLEVAIPSMYFLTGGTAGFTIHVAHGAVLGVGFAAIASQVPGLTAAKSVGLGVGYGVAIWVALAVLLMPLWLSAVGSPANPPFPNVNTTSLVGHVVYGAVVGVAYHALR